MKKIDIRCLTSSNQLLVGGVLAPAHRDTQNGNKKRCQIHLCLLRPNRQLPEENLILSLSTYSFHP